MTQMLELPDKNSKEAMIKNASVSNFEHTWNKRKNPESYKETTNESLVVKNKNKKTVSVRFHVIKF
jgi:hypothetical protein